MSVTTASTDVRRDRADWMQPLDEHILEALSEEGNLTPQAIENLDVTVRSHASMRLSKLRKYGLVERFADTEGLYAITDAGERFLSGDLDAAELEPTDS